MAKWADFVIVEVKYNREHSAIVEVKARPDLGDKLGEVTRVKRLDVVEAIDDEGQTFVTAYKREGKWTKGEEVGVVTIHREKFIRTDSNNIRADNLGELPEYT